MILPQAVTLVEVGPRDGLQNIPAMVPTAIKLALIHNLEAAGLSVIETTSFVSPKWVPQMADHVTLMQQLTPKPGVTYPVLVPNDKGLQAAIQAGVKTIAVFGSCSETFSRKNINCSIDESIARFATVITKAKKNHIAIRGYISCVMGCPYEGAVALGNIIKVAKALYDLGCYEISLGDTIGVGNPKAVQNLIAELSAHLPLTALAVHFHDTYGQALANILMALQCGITTIDSAVAGLGGCPYAKGASGNVATEEVLYLCHGLGIETGIDLNQVIQAGRKICEFLNIAPQSKVNCAY